jgi:hypothetical protein
LRTLSVSRATVRKVIRGHKTEFKYARGVRPTPKLGDWVEALTEIDDCSVLHESKANDDAAPARVQGRRTLRSTASELERCRDLVAARRAEDDLVGVTGVTPRGIPLVG